MSFGSWFEGAQPAMVKKAMLMQESGECCLPHFPLFLQPQIPVQGMVPAKFSMGLPSLVNFPEDTQECVS